MCSVCDILLTLDALALTALLKLYLTGDSSWCAGYCTGGGEIARRNLLPELLAINMLKDYKAK